MTEQRHGWFGGRITEEVRITALYLVFAGAWIFFSDQAVNQLVGSASEVLRWSIFKGWAFVIITGSLLYLVLQQAFGQTRATQEDLERRVENRTAQLTEANHKLEEEVAERRRAEQEIRQLNERLKRRTDDLEVINGQLEDFSYSVTHDLRAPLRAIGGFSQIISRRYRDTLNDEGRRYFDHIVQASGHMERLIEDLLRYSRLGRHGMSRQPVPLAGVLDEVSRTFAQRVQERHAELRIPAELPAVRGDHTLLVQIFTNLVDNALTYCRPGVRTQVAVEVRRQGPQVLVAVSDNGIGIAAENVEKVFRVFQRLHSDEEFPGTGIGLAVVRKAAELMGGRVWAESTLGQGTTFFVELQGS